MPLPKIDRTPKEDTSWIPKAVETAKEMMAASEEGLYATAITVDGWVQNHAGMTEEVAERQLRKLTTQGWLIMRKVKLNNAFLRYEWVLA